MPQTGNKINQRQSLDEIYGSRRGLILTYLNRILYLLGRYRRYKQVDWSSIKRLVFVCKGNICRSAYAEAVAKSLGIESISCGIDTVDGKPADDDAIRIASIRGIDLTHHKTKKISSVSFQTGDLFVVMELNQAKHLERRLGENYMFTLLGLWGRPITPYINDPYGKPRLYFENCFNYIENSIYAINKKIGTTP